MSQFLANFLDLDLHKVIRDSSGYHRIEQIDGIYRSLWFLDFMCRYNKLEPSDGDDEESQQLVTKTAGLVQECGVMFARAESL